jgi:NAD(P)H-dependent FMN reductase
LLYHLPVQAVAGKPVGIVTIGGTQDHILAVDWQPRNVLVWSGALIAPPSVHLSGNDFISRELAEDARLRFGGLARAIVELLLEPRNSFQRNF